MHKVPDTETYTFKGYTIPARMMPSIKAYITKGRSVGNFLGAIISNNLIDAISHADTENLAQLPAYAGYFYNVAPDRCWGTHAKMDKWRRDGGEAGIAKAELAKKKAEEQPSPDDDPPPLRYA